MSNYMQFIRTPAGVLLSGFAFGILAATIPLVTFWNELHNSQADAARAMQTNAELESKIHTLQAERAKTDAALQLAQQEKQTSLQHLKRYQDLQRHQEAIQSFVLTKFWKPGPDVDLRKRVDAVLPGIADSLKNQPRAEAAARAFLGAALLALQDAGAAVIQFEQSQHLLLKLLGPEHPLTLASAMELAAAYQAAGRPSASVDVLEQSLANLPDKLDGMPALAGAYRAAGRFEETANMYREALPAEQQRSGNNSLAARALSRNLAEVLQAGGKYAQAAAIYDQLVTASPKNGDRTLRINDKLRLATAYAASGENQKALSLYQQLLANGEFKIAPTTPQNMDVLKGMANCYQALQRYSNAITCYQELLRAQSASAGPDAADVLATKTSLADAYLATDKVPEAVQLYKEVQATWARKLGANHLQTIHSARKLGIAYCKSKQYDRAQATLARVVSELEIKQSSDWVLFDTKSWLGEAISAKGNYAEAEALLLQSYEGLKRRLSSIPQSDRKSLAASGQRLVKLYEVWGKQAAAQKWREIGERSKIHALQ